MKLLLPALREEGRRTSGRRAVRNRRETSSREGRVDEG